MDSADKASVRFVTGGGTARHGKQETPGQGAQHRPAQSVAPRYPFVNLSSDWYWEQDAELRFTHVRSATTCRAAGARARRRT